MSTQNSCCRNVGLNCKLMLTYLHVANINYLIMIGIDLVPMGGGGEAIFSQTSQKAIVKNQLLYSHTITQMHTRIQAQDSGCRMERKRELCIAALALFHSMTTDESDLLFIE